METRRGDYYVESISFSKSSKPVSKCCKCFKGYNYKQSESTGATKRNTVFESSAYEHSSKIFVKNEQQLLKTFLLSRLHKFLYGLFQDVIKHDFGVSTNLEMECYMIDSKIIQCIIRNIIQSEEYTLEGIAYHTRIPFDVIFDAACGKNSHLSITSWFKIVDLYLQINPDLSGKLFDNLKRIQDKHELILSILRNEI